jgi:hypothetical protein
MIGENNMDRIPVYKSLHAEKTIMGLPTFTFYFLIVFSVAILIILKSLLAIIPILFIVFVIKYISRNDTLFLQIYFSSLLLPEEISA